MSSKPIIGFAGMTHLGVNSAVASAERGFETLGFDADVKRIATLQSRKTDITEPQLLELLASNAERLQFTHEISDLKRCDIIYISLDVPTDDEAKSDLTPIRAMIDKVNTVMREDALLVVLCQVPPGFTRSISRAPERLYYQVETLIFGKAVERAMYPERYMIGCADPTKPMDARFRAYLEAYGCPILPMRYESAELAKTAINLFLAASVCTANTLAEICEKIGADWQEIIPSLRLDRRIGQYAYIETGLGLSGGNIERDLKTIADLATANDAKPAVPLAYMEHSRYRKQWPARTFFAHYKPRAGFTLAVLGLAYKVNTHSVKNSPAIELIEAMPDIRIQAYDPVVKKVTTGKAIHHCSDALEAVNGADIVCIMTPWDEFRQLDWAAMTASMHGKVLIDPYQLVTAEQARGCAHVILGKPDRV